MSQDNTHRTKEPGFRETLRSDFRQGDFRKSVRQDWREVRAFFLSDEQKQRLDSMSMFKKVFVVPYWLFRAMYMHLTPARRLLLLTGVVMLLFMQTTVSSGNMSTSTNWHIVGGFIILFILLLELKDKILARDELEAGRAVQEALMPDAHPRFPNWDIWIHTCPANDVGGDLVDYINVDEHRLGLSLGDVAGKGLGAALFMAKLQATLRALAPQRASVADLARQVNLIFERDGIPNRFASLLYLEVSSDSGDVHFVNAGHMPPLLLRGDQLTELERGSAALGILSDPAYRTQSHTLVPGDILCVYSDGLTEARNERGEFFGDERFYKLLSRLGNLDAARIGTHLLERIHRYTGDARQHDDISLLLLRYAPEAESPSE
ncbi:MAG: PP2C family protein-serine/threonine phosphatase [Bacteroidota bacterium]|nr:PP2C family protein-serine/threonine phosphatase [Bacteroidota bacterium]